MGESGSSNESLGSQRPRLLTNEVNGGDGKKFKYITSNPNPLTITIGEIFDVVCHRRRYEDVDTVQGCKVAETK